MKNQQTTITTAAPGKIHVMGEHAVVYGKPALLCAIPLGCQVQLLPSSNDAITISSRNLNKRASYSQRDIEKLIKESERKWKVFQKNNDSSLQILEDLDYPAIAIGETLKYFSQHLPSGFDLIIDSAIPVGSGLGSSAALSVAVVAATMGFIDKKFDKEMINTIALLVEQKKHGMPSGGDNTVACYGGLLLFQKSSPQRQQRVSFSKELTKRFFLVDSGRPVESTGQMVSFVRSFKEGKKKMFNTFLRDQEKIIQELVVHLKKGNDASVSELIKNGQRNLERIGVVSDSGKALIALIEKEGGAAKISGAGGRAKGSGMLLVYHPEKEQLKQVFITKKIPFFDVILGSEGVSITL